MLTLRLQTLLDMVPEVDSILDVGTDHCLLPIAIKQRYPNMQVAASDVSKGPLKIAKKQLEAHDQNDIELYLSDGLISIPKQFDCVIMAGMGAQTMIKILSDRAEYAHACKYFLLQANTDVDELREWLFCHNYVIVDETMVYDYKYYQILLVCHGSQDYNREDVLFGPILRKKQSIVYQDYWKNEKRKLEEILGKLPFEHRKVDDIRELLVLIEQNLDKG